MVALGTESRLIVAMLVSSPTPPGCLICSRLVLVCRSWSDRHVTMPDAAITSMLGLSSYLPDEASVKAAVALLRAVERPPRATRRHMSPFLRNV